LPPCQHHRSPPPPDQRRNLVPSVCLFLWSAPSMNLPVHWKVKSDDHKGALSSMRIGELADAADTTTKTLRYYEAIGLLPPPDRARAVARLPRSDALATRFHPSRPTRGTVPGPHR